jgi:uncharacterized protein YcfJ
MKAIFNTIVGVAAAVLGTTAMAQLTFYEHDGFQGRSFSTNRQVADFQRGGFNDESSSVIVDRGRWEVCEDAQFSGQCFVLQPGQYPSLGSNDRISSVRPAASRGRAEAVVSPPALDQRYEYYPRYGEKLYTAEVTAARAVVSQPEQRCWVDREQVGGDTGANIPGAIVGGILGGVLGHQIGGGHGQDVATALGAVGGAAVGANVGRGGDEGRGVQRCTSVSGPVRPDYWDVTYVFRGREHRMQMAARPGATITVNQAGDPRM